MAANATVREDAARWFLRMRTAPLPQGERLAFDAWLNAHPDHAREYAGFDTLWQDFGATDRAQALASAATAQRRRQRRHVTRGLLGLAGLGCMAWLLRAHWRAADAARFTLARATAIGQFDPVALPDGSALRLGGSTSIEVAFDSAQRAVRLAQGQALFNVAPDPARPFIVDCAGARITVVGTVFSVDRLPGSVRVSVQEGVVRLASRDNLQAPLELRAGQVGAWYDAAAPGSTPQRLAGLRAEDAFAIERGLVVFELATLEEIAATLSRYHPLAIRALPAAGQVAPRITAAVQLRQVDDFLRALPHLGAVRVQRAGSEIVLSAR
ncbi:FecR domain-containing protein [Acidovorax sp. CCYZU-2555]|uniref:FecR family protein n=1 Tax=Acidovorax sp. CCYZU-2555 TaxID=2835042 RepID=UPI001BD0565A|nr:FecR domain-containing protein [Acidovorax sp. CCYZU-2555]MBS7778329.1 FecR domain-containing protein [Acidovorax sp. CCYZU-2555]